MLISEMFMGGLSDADKQLFAALYKAILNYANGRRTVMIHVRRGQDTSSPACTSRCR